MGPLRELCAGALGVAAAAVLGTGLAAPAPATAGGIPYDQLVAMHGIAPAGSPYRWEAISPHGAGITVVERIDRDGGRVSRWWTLRGSWYLTAPTYDGTGAGLAGGESVLVLTHLDFRTSAQRRYTRLAILDTRPHRRHGPSSVQRVTLPGDFSVYALSADGAMLYLARLEPGSAAQPRFTLHPYDLRRHRLLPTAAIRDNGEVLWGTAIARTEDAGHDNVYTLYVDSGGRVAVLALDTFARTLQRIEFPRLRHSRNPFTLRPVLDPARRRLNVTAPMPKDRNRRRVVAAVALRRLALPPRRPPAPVGAFTSTVGRSRQGRPIELVHIGNFNLPGRMLVFGCIHGDECGASGLEPLENGCPDPDVNAYVVPDLDPDGSAVRSRLNARGVDLNRNFRSRWRPIGMPGSPEYSGPRPFSEPEARLAARLVRRLHPRVTVWFHQHWGDSGFVRAWGQSVPAARRFARLAGLRFRLLPWPAGTGPNWQNHRFPGTSSFVVEAPRGRLDESLRMRLTRALSQTGEQVGDDPGVPRKG